MIRDILLAVALVAVLSILPRQSALAQPAPVSYTDNFLRAIKSDAISQESSEAIIEAYRRAAEEMQWNVRGNIDVTFVQPFEVSDGAGVQVILMRHDLDNNAFVFIASQHQSVFQRLSAKDLERYDMKSAFFPNGKLTVSVVVHSDGSRSNKSNQIELERLRVLSDKQVTIVPLVNPKSVDDLYNPRAINEGGDIIAAEAESLCGPDNRTDSTDKRVGRIMPIGCTGWLIGDDLALTAGHCHSGIRMNILEFQVPKSSTSGVTHPAHPNDQYPIIKTTIKSEDGGYGHDWAVFRLGPNSNTGMLPGEAQGGVFKLSRHKRPTNATTVTGFGVDNTPRGSSGNRNSDNQTQQTEDGGGAANVRYYGTPSTGSYFRYEVDTTGGNSGSPAFGNDGVAFAIHSHAGCEDGGNHGTALDNEDLRTAIRQFVGDLSTVYVDENESPPCCGGGSADDHSPEESPLAVSPERVPIIEGYPSRIIARLNIRSQRALSAAAKSVFERALLWTPGRQITVAFNGGTTTARREIEEIANTWADLANFSLQFRNSNDEFLEWTTNDRRYSADIRVAFTVDGYWSLVGTDSRNRLIVAPGEASMNLEGMSNGSLSEDERGTVLHEFGHALGFHHEHQSPQSGCDQQFRWEDDPGYIPTLNGFDEFVADSNGRRPGIYTMLGGAPNEWSRDVVDHNLRQIIDSDAYVATAHDTLSIMHYSFGSWMFIDGRSSPCHVSRNNVLSAMDRAGVATAYPQNIESPGNTRADVSRAIPEALKSLFWTPESANVETKSLLDTSSLDLDGVEWRAVVNELHRRNAISLQKRPRWTHKLVNPIASPRYFDDFQAEASGLLTPHSHLSSVPTRQLFRMRAEAAKRVYGDDDRKDIHRLVSTRDAFVANGIPTDGMDAILANARATASVINASAVTAIPNQNKSLISTDVYGVDPDFCPSERFIGQPTASFCTAFFVGEDIIVTAGHCVDATNVTDRVFMFDFAISNSDDTLDPLIVENSKLYRGTELLGWSYNRFDDDVPDWAVVRVDRKVTDREPVKLRTDGKIVTNTRVYVLGNPSGLPLKFADGANVKGNSHDVYFLANLDTYGGNSGGPVFNAVTHELEGILVRGGRDFELLVNDSTRCVQTVYVGNDDGPGEAVTRTAVFDDKVQEHLTSPEGKSSPGGNEVETTK